MNVKSSIFLPGQNTNSVDTWRFEIRRANCVIVLTSVDVFDNAILREAIEYAANRAKNKDLQLYLAELTPYTWDDLEALNIQKPYVLSERPMSSESSREVFWTTVKSKFHAFLEKIHLSY